MNKNDDAEIKIITTAHGIIKHEAEVELAPDASIDIVFDADFEIFFISFDELQTRALYL